EKARKALEPVIDEGIRTALAKEKDEGRRRQAEAFLKALTPTLKSGEIDAAVSLRGPQNDHYGVIIGVKLKEGDRLDQTLRDLLRDLPPNDRAKIKFDAETAGGVKVHRIDVQQSLDAKARQAVGDNPLYVAFRPDAVFVALGEGGLSALKQA